MTARARTTAPAAQTETRRFSMHPKMLMDVIKRQAGTVQKAILEGVMNSVDAGADRCDVVVRPDVIKISDTGRGITDRADIEKFFETFGQPHEAREGKVYGTFRMGRGQMFSFGKNTWRTGPFKMVVDINARGLDYDLQSGLREAAGCDIEIALYEPLLPSTLAEVERTIKKWVEYAPGVVTVNGERVNRDPADEEWDHVTDEAYVRLKESGALTIYNLGVHTMDLASFRFGTGGLVVSRKQLQVNFARNDVMASCKVWQKIRPLIDGQTRKKLAKKPDLTDAERQRLADLIVQGEPPEEAHKLRLFTAVNGRHYSADQLYEANHEYHRKATACGQGHRMGYKVFQQKLAFVFAETTLTRFGQKDLVGLLKVATKVSRQGKGKYLPSQTLLFNAVPFESVIAGLSDSYDLVDDAATTPVEKIWIDLAGRMLYVFQPPDRSGYSRERKMVIGKSDAADGWTDGLSFVAIDRKFLATLTFDFQGFTDLGLLLAHEVCHDGPDTAEHVHGMEFYERFHNLVWDVLPKFVAGCMGRLTYVFKAAGRELPKHFLKDANNIERTRRGLAGLLATTEAALTGR